MTSYELVAELRKAAVQIANEGHAGWGNLCLLAIEAIEGEREACAKIADDAREDEEYGHAAFRCVQIAQNIRARGEPPSRDALDYDESIGA